MKRLLSPNRLNSGMVVRDSDGFGVGSDSDGFGRIPGPQIWKSPTQGELKRRGVNVR